MPRMLRSLFSFRARPRRAQYAAVATCSVALLLSTWELIAVTGVFPRVFFPTIGDVWASAALMFGSGVFEQDIAASVARILVAFAVSAIIAVPLGLLMSSFKGIEALVEPLVDFIRYVPVPSLIPIFVLWTGIGELSKFLVLFFGTFFQLVLLVMDDADNVPHLYFDMARTMGANTRELIRDVLIPAIKPQLYDRLRVTLGWCWTYLIIAELIAADRGIGHALKEAQRFNASAQMFVCFVVLGLIGLFTDYSAKLLYRRLFPYASKALLQAK